MKSISSIRARVLAGNRSTSPAARHEMDRRPASRRGGACACRTQAHAALVAQRRARRSRAELRRRQRILFTRGRSNLTHHAFGGRLRRAIRIAAHPGFARQISASRLVLHPGRQRAPASRDDSRDRKKRTARDRRARLDSRIAPRHQRRRRRRAPAESGHRLSDQGYRQASGRISRSWLGLQPVHPGP